jgi:hypothetical protein
VPPSYDQPVKALRRGSHSLVEKTVDYIHRQVGHHRKRTFEDEFRAILETQEVEYDERYLLG